MASKTVVLVHGGFVDGSGWRRVYDILRTDGYDVSVVQNPTLSTTEDRMIPPAAQQMMSERAGSTVEEVAASHSVYVSQPGAVAAIIEKAAAAT